jgi:hypothetical protein
MYKVYAAFLMSLGVALTLASNQAAKAGHGGVSASMHSTFHRTFARSHHHGRNRRDFFPGSFFEGPYDQPYSDIAPPVSGPVSNDAYDVPWDWAHRYPPGFFESSPQPSSPPMAYVPGCNKETVTVPGADGRDHTVNVVRC